MGDTQYDVIVIGGGPGGYVCAIRAAQLGLKTACVEGRGALGGTCLNVGCIPSKALLAASEQFESAQHHFAEIGIKADGVALDLSTMMKHKDKVVAANVQGIEFLFKKNKVDWLKGWGRVDGAGQVSVTGDDGQQTYSTKHIVIATGSEVTPLPGIEIDEKRILSSTGALDLPDVPKKMVVIGGGVIGLEMGTVWRRLGAEVEVVEFLDRLLPGMDNELAKETLKIMKKQGLKFRLSSKVTGASADDDGVTLTVEPSQGGDAEEIRADAVLVAIGRRPNINGLGLEEAGVAVSDRGVVLNDHFRTNVDGIWVIGDCTSGPMLAHKAEEEGVAVAEMIVGQKPHVDHNLVPGVVYTWPEIASVGQTEEQLREAAIKYNKGKFPYMANGRARAMNATDGFVKILADAETDRVLGCHIIGAEAGTLIAEVALAMEFGASSEDIARTCHAHPTLNEIVKEAALAVEGRAVHM